MSLNNLKMNQFVGYTILKTGSRFKGDACRIIYEKASLKFNGQWFNSHRNPLPSLFPFSCPLPSHLPLYSSHITLNLKNSQNFISKQRKIFNQTVQIGKVERWHISTQKLKEHSYLKLLLHKKKISHKTSISEQQDKKESRRFRSPS